MNRFNDPAARYFTNMPRLGPNTPPPSDQLALESTLQAINLKIPQLGQATMALSVPVVLASNQSPIPISGSVTATVPTPLPVSQSGPWSITANAGTDLDTSALLLDATFTSRINTLGQKTMATSTPVVISSDQSAIPISGTVTATVPNPLPVSQSGTWILGANSGVDIGDVTINNAAGASAVNIQDGGNSITVDGTVAATQSGTWILGANSGVDIGDVTINNAAGASAVNIQDGGNSITVDGTVSAAQSGAWSVTANAGTNLNTSALLLDATFTARINTLGQKTMATSTPIVIASDQSAVPISGTVTATVPNPLPVSQSGTWILGANSGVDIGDVTINNAAGASAVNIQDGGNSITVDGTVAATQSGTWILGANSGVDIGDVTINNAAGASAVNIQDGGNSITVDGTVSAAQSGTWNIATLTTITNPVTVVGAAASGVAKSGNPVQIGGVFNTTQPTVTNGQSVEAQATARGALIVATGVDAFAVNATLTAETTKVIGTVRTADGSGNLLTSTGNALDVNLKTSSITLPVSLASVPTHAITIASGGVASGAYASGAMASGAYASGSIASGAIASGALASGSIVAGAVAAGATSFVKLEDVASADADAGVPAMAIRKATPANTSGTDGDYEMLQMSAGRLWVDPSGVTLTVATHAITIASGGVASGAYASGAMASGAYASGSIASGAIASGALASGSIVAGAVAAGATSFVKLEDVASADADAGVPAMAIRKATPANTSGTDGDYEMLQMSAGRLWVDPSGVTLTVATHAITIASGGVASGAIASGALASGSVASGAVASGAFASGSISAGAVAAGATSFVKLEDVASADADAGVPAMAIRKATPANTSGTDSDYEMLQMSAGRLWVNSTGVRTALTGSAPTAASVGTSSGTAVASNANRKGLILTNTSGAFISLGLEANAAVLYSGITIFPYGTWEMSEYSFSTGAVTAIASIASSNLGVQELT